MAPEETEPVGTGESIQTWLVGGHCGLAVLVVELFETPGVTGGATVRPIFGAEARDVLLDGVPPVAGPLDIGPRAAGLLTAWLPAAGPLGAEEFDGRGPD